MRHTTVLKSCVRLLLPAHSPATIVAEVSNPNQFRPCVMFYARQRPVLNMSSGLNGLQEVLA